MPMLSISVMAEQSNMNLAFVYESVSDKIGWSMNFSKARWTAVLKRSKFVKIRIASNRKTQYRETTPEEENPWGRETRAFQVGLKNKWDLAWKEIKGCKCLPLSSENDGHQHRTEWEDETVRDIDEYSGSEGRDPNKLKNDFLKLDSELLKFDGMENSKLTQSVLESLHRMGISLNFPKVDRIATRITADKTHLGKYSK